ncbi:hypothetical protein E2553_24870 [Paraburkholderia dipogonis]|uniref:Uncharacterized protein n=1 Tax=Paraburkholderia dipogonis TaxID=1211383 RepID=A0A4Y8MRU8_9BURK|nr:hypothetical protein [Paraburkholderia dipogonis]TFE40023.1 hypothetical protein E2553_24870 [Paraburkholderia dipogonis]
MQLTVIFVKNNDKSGGCGGSESVASWPVLVQQNFPDGVGSHANRPNHQPTGAQMNSLKTPLMAVSPYLATSIKTAAARVSAGQKPSLYTIMLQAPMNALASNVSDRADVSSVAILGYN